MRRRASFLLTCGLVAGVALSGCGGASSSLPGGTPPSARDHSGSSPIAHVVFVVQENRSFDNLFADFPGVDGATRGRMKVKVNGRFRDRWVTLQAHALVTPFDIQHCHTAFLTDYDNGKMDGFGQVDRGPCGSHGKPALKAPYQYVEPSQIAPYWAIANQWGLADEMFQTQGSGSFTAHQDMIRGSTQINKRYSLVDNPSDFPWGCDSGQYSKTSLITKGGGYLAYQRKGPFPCTNAHGFNASYYEVISDLLDAKSVSWKYYSPCFKGWDKNSCDYGCPAQCSGGVLNAFDVIAHVRYGPEWGTNVSMPETNVFTDITNGNLAAVSWVIPSDANSDHPGEACGCDDGPSWVASVVNAVGLSSYWNSTAIVVLWDDWGGFYDHVAPQQRTFGGLGFRIPMMVLSPYVKKGSGSQGGYISSTQYEYGSLLRFIEDNWSLGRLGTTDSSANSISDMFDFSQTKRTFTKIPSQHSIEFFEHQKATPQNGDPE